MRRGRLPKVGSKSQASLHASCNFRPSKLVSPRVAENCTLHATTPLIGISALGNGQRFSFDGHKHLNATRQRGHFTSHFYCQLDCDRSTNNLFYLKKDICHVGHCPAGSHISHANTPLCLTREKCLCPYPWRWEFRVPTRNAAVPRLTAGLLLRPRCRRARPTPGRHAAACAPHHAPNAHTRTHGRMIP